MNKDHKIKIVFNSRENGNFQIEEDMIEGKLPNGAIKSFSTSSSVSALPNSKLQLEPTSKYPYLISIKKKDGVTFYIKSKSEDYKKVFQGIVSVVKVKIENDVVELDLECISEFFKLQVVNLNYYDFMDTNGLRELLDRLLIVCKINGRIMLDNSIDDNFNLTPFSNFPALSLINAICYQLDLVYDFRTGDDMYFSKREDTLNKMKTTTPTIIRDIDIISSEFYQ